ncbi:hypothetical protein J3R82DRAFT_3882 [Butyriboletus roseoflavus]|nr:hypothetical protein J3R82DRAFT_3882 [Butyriboletus roseoflavus]
MKPHRTEHLHPHPFANLLKTRRQAEQRRDWSYKWLPALDPFCIIPPTANTTSPTNRNGRKVFSEADGKYAANNHLPRVVGFGPTVVTQKSEPWSFSSPPRDFTSGRSRARPTKQPPPDPSPSPPTDLAHYRSSPLHPPDATLSTPRSSLRRTGPKTSARGPRSNVVPTNRQIPFRHVLVIDPETNKLSRTKQSLEVLLGTWSKQGRVIELVASTPEPIVRVTTRSEVEARYREMKRALRKGAKVGEEPKEVQLTWGIANADLEHKLRKAKRDLEKGYRVAVVVTMKRRHRPSNQQELVAFADEISAALCEAGEEWKAREFTERLMMLSFRKAELKDNILSDSLGDIYST